MSFHEIRFPTSVSFGASGGPERQTDIVALANGFEERNTAWAHSRRRYEAGLGVSTLDQLEEVMAFFEARMGRLYGFRWKDWADFRSCSASAVVAFDDQEIGIGDGSLSTFSLKKSYISGQQTYVRPISKPVVGSVQVGVDGAQLTEGADFTIAADTGVVTFTTPPAIGETVTAGFEFDVPVRFESDRIEVSLATFQAGEIPDVPVVEVRV